MASTASKYIKVRAEEVVIGALVGIGTGAAVAAPIAMGLPSMNPLAAGIGAWAALQAGVLWAGIAGGGVIGAWWAARQTRDSHVSGHSYIRAYGEAATALQAGQRKRFSPRQRKGEVRGLSIGGVELSRAQEVRHIVAVGLQGAGKSAFINSVIDQGADRGGRFLIHDPAGEYVKSYFDLQTCVLLGPWVEQAAIWDAASDFSNPILAREFAAATIGKVEGEGKFFYDAAANLLSGLIISFMAEGRAWTWKDLWEPLTGDALTLVQQAAKGNPAVKQNFPGAFPPEWSKAHPVIDKSGPDVISTMATKCTWLAQYAAVDREDTPRFSVKKWLLGQDHRNVKMVILNANPDYTEAGQAIFGAILNVITNTLNSDAMPLKDPDDAGGVWALMDELPQIGVEALASVQKLSELGRKRGVRVILAVQDETQIAGMLGNEQKAKPVLAVGGAARVFLQCSEETADAVSKRIGEREVNRIETTSENGAMAGKQKKLVTQRVIQQSELTGLDVRDQIPPLGVELVLHIGDTLGRLLHPFPERHKAKVQVTESDVWKMGTLPGWLEAHGYRPQKPAPDAEPAAPSAPVAQDEAGGVTPFDPAEPAGADAKPKDPLSLD